MSAKEKPVEKVTAGHIRASLRKHYPAPRCAIAFEVPNATGFNARRHLDAMAMDLWPSHGLKLHGIEIKISRSDLNRELVNPAKAEELARYCDDFFIAAPKGVVDPLILPPAWGLMERMPDGKIRIAKAATETEAEPIGRPFFAAMFRAASTPIDRSELDDMMSERIEEIRKAHDERHQRDVEYAVRNKTEELAKDAAAYRQIIEIIGEDEARSLFRNRDEIVYTIRALYKLGPHRTYSSVRRLRDAVKTAQEDIEAAMALMKPPEEGDGENAEDQDSGQQRRLLP